MTSSEGSQLSGRILEILRRELAYLIRDGIYKTHQYLMENVTHFADMCLMDTHPNTTALSVEDPEMRSYLHELEEYIALGGFKGRRKHLIAFKICSNFFSFFRSF